MINIDTRLLDMVDANEAWLMLHLARYFNQNNRCWPSNAKLLEATKWSSNTLLKTKRSLMHKGLLTSEQRYREDGSKSTNTYTFNTKMIGVYVNATEFKEDAKIEDTTPQILHSPTPQILQGTPTQNCIDNEVLVREVLTIEEESVVLSNDAPSKKAVRKKPAVRQEVQEMTDAVINYLNKVTGREFESTTIDSINAIKYWMDQGITFDDFKKVIDFQTSEWLNDEKMKKYLHPDTLFSKKKFKNKYLADANFCKAKNAMPDPSAPHYQLAMHIQNTYPNLWSSNVRIFNAAEYADYQNNVTMKGMALQAADNKRKALAAIMAKLNEDYGMRQKYNSLFDAYIALAKTYLP